MAKKAQNKGKQAVDNADHRTFLSLGEVGDTLRAYTETDPRFSYRSEAARHLIVLGIKADKRARDKALAAVKV